MDAAIQIASSIRAEDIRGEIRIVPVANLAGLMSKTMFTVPQDGGKLSGAFPGCAGGSYTSQLAHLLYRELVEPADIMLELRGGELVEDMAHYVSVQRTGDKTYDEKALELAKVFGCRNIILRKTRTEPNPGESPYAAATFAGKLGMLAEAGGWGLRRSEDVAFLTEGIRNVAAHMGILKDIKPPTNSDKENVYFESFVDVFSDAEGFFDCEVAAGDTVKQGQLLGRIRSFFGETLSELHAEEEGVILGIVTAAGVTPGTVVIGLGRPMA